MMYTIIAVIIVLWFLIRSGNLEPFSKMRRHVFESGSHEMDDNDYGRRR
jgi:hypothetical protein